jgi:segregation and condensation protein B
VAGGFQLMTRAKFAPWLRRLHSAAPEVRLSAPALETLAVVAYRQPVLRVDVEAIRGVQSDEVLRQLIERDLVRIVGRSDQLGRPFLYGTTRQFLQVFGLRHLDELPRAEVLRPRQPPAPGDQNLPDTPSSSHQSPVAEEETNVKTLITRQPRQNALAEESCSTAIRPSRDDRRGNQGIFAKADEGEEAEEEFDDELDEEEDLDDEEEEEEDDEDLDDEPWEEVDDEEEEFDDDEEDEDWDEDEDWEDEDEDWDDEEEDWDDDEEEEEEEEEAGDE